jgi:hypothetical protein
MPNSIALQQASDASHSAGRPFLATVSSDQSPILSTKFRVSWLLFLDQALATSTTFPLSVMLLDMLLERISQSRATIRVAQPRTWYRVEEFVSLLSFSSNQQWSECLEASNARSEQLNCTVAPPGGDRVRGLLNHTTVSLRMVTCNWKKMPRKPLRRRHSSYGALHLP